MFNEYKLFLNLIFFKFIETIVYDDACHLLKFCTNPVRSSNTETAKRLGNMSILCDRFHFRNHIDPWC